MSDTAAAEWVEVVRSARDTELIEAASDAVCPVVCGVDADHSEETAPRQCLMAAWAAYSAIGPRLRAEVREEVARAIEAVRPHLPPSSDPSRRELVVARSWLNRATRIARGGDRG